jgi:hypothetical protein
MKKKVRKLFLYQKDILFILIYISYSLSEEVEPMSSELDSVQSELDFSVFNDISMHLSSPPPLQPLHQGTTTFSNNKDDISASQSDVYSSMTSSTAGVAINLMAGDSMASTTAVDSMTASTARDSLTATIAGDSMAALTAGDSMTATTVNSKATSTAFTSMKSSTAGDSMTSSTASTSATASTNVVSRNSSVGLEEMAIKNLKQIICL